MHSIPPTASPCFEPGHPIASPNRTPENVSDPGIDRFELLAIAFGGAIGGLIRIAMDQALPTAAGSWPWATFSVNMAGALMLGYFVTRLQERLPVSTLRRPLLGTGLCGALTTFSTVQIELLKMADQHRYGLALGYLFASVLGGYFAVFGSSALVRRVRTIS
ncbi:MAG TPA: fluoride efflux transporter CrcB [Solirubrobacteraceae bacterium]|nr:fluoride efflux transporter CrcB [Solirubrobacteraceae bacterium]